MEQEAASNAEDNDVGVKKEPTEGKFQLKVCF